MLFTLQYVQDVSCPFNAQERQETVDWLLGLAVRFEYGDNGRLLDFTFTSLLNFVKGVSVLHSCCGVHIDP